MRRARVESLLAERFRFESLLSELSARLIPVSLGDVDTEIERGLQRVVEFLRMDRASLIEYVPAGTVVRIAWAVEGVERLSPILEARSIPLDGRPGPAGRGRAVLPARRAARGGGDRSEELPGLGHPVVSGASAECPRVRCSARWPLTRSGPSAPGRTSSCSACSSSARSSPGRSSESAWSCCWPSGCASRPSCRSSRPRSAACRPTEVDREIKRALRADRRLLQGRLGQSGRALPRQPAWRASRTPG